MKIISDYKRVRRLESENQRLKKLLGEIVA
jgi:hypothetical protein